MRGLWVMHSVLAFKDRVRNGICARCRARGYWCGGSGRCFWDGDGLLGTDIVAVGKVWKTGETFVEEWRRRDRRRGCVWTEMRGRKEEKSGVLGMDMDA